MYQPSPLPRAGHRQHSVGCRHTYPQPTRLVLVRRVIEVDRYATLAVRGGVRGFEEIVGAGRMECTYDLAVRKISSVHLCSQRRTETSENGKVLLFSVRVTGEAEMLRVTIAARMKR